MVCYGITPHEQKALILNGAHPLVALIVGRVPHKAILPPRFRSDV